MPEPRLAGLLLAAGGSARLGQAKQMVTLLGETLVRRSAALLLDRACPVVAVTGATADAVSDELRDLPVKITHNQNWRAGMGGSIAIGMAAVGDEPEGVLVLLCDQWRIGEDDLDSLCAHWQGNPSQIVAARWEAQFGAPAIFPRRLFGELRCLAGEKGAKQLVEREAGRLIGLPNAGYDLDTPEDLAALGQWGRSRG